MSGGFVHSVKVPRFYKVTAKTVQTVEEEGASIKQVIYKKEHPNLRGTYGLALTTIHHGPQLDQILRKTQLLFKEPRLDPWMARVLIAELLWGKKSLPSEAKPIKTILSYEKVLREEAENAEGTSVETAAKNKTVRKPRYVRINTLVKSVEDSIRSFEEEGWTLLPKSDSYAAFLKALTSLGEGMYIQDFHIPELFAFPCGTHFYDHPGYTCGAIVLQDKASCIPAQFLNPASGSTVLDMCSAPGMKTTHLAAIMKNQGKIIAVERDARRYQILCDIVKTNAADCVKTINADALKLKSDECANVEYILVDPSCSGSGMDRVGRDNTESKCAPARLQSLQSFQVLLLRHALLHFPKVKRVVYSTCSMYPEENEMVIDEILGNIGDAYNLVPMKTLIGPGWKNFSSADYKCQDKCLYARPEIDLCNGFFVAVFERNVEVPLPEYKRKNAPENPSNDAPMSGDGERQMGKKKNRKRRKSKGASADDNVKMAEESISDEVQQSKAQEEAIVDGQKRRSKSSEMKNGSVGDEILDEGEPPKKQKKKKKHTEPESQIHADMQVEVASATNGDDPPLENEKKKKKRKKNEHHEEILDEVNGTSESLLVQEQEVKKDEDKKKRKKKKKEKSNSEEKEEIIQVVDEIPESPAVEEHEIEKKKKKKKKDKKET